MEVCITYRFEGYPGPYQKIFTDQSEALEWVRDNDIEIICIDIN